jgi:hypothetical protein
VSKTVKKLSRSKMSNTIKAIEDEISRLEDEAEDMNIVIQASTSSEDDKAKARVRLQSISVQLGTRREELRQARDNAAAPRGLEGKSEIRVPASSTKSQPKISEALAAIKDMLQRVNGLDVFTPESTPDGYLSKRRAMRIPRSLFDTVTTFDANKIGISGSIADDQDYVLRIAAVNYRALHEDNHPKAPLVAILRAVIAVQKFWPEGSDIEDGDMRRGRYCRKNEIILVDDDEDVDLTDDGVVVNMRTGLNELTTAFANIDEEELQAMMRLLPIFASNEFQKTNHHYVDNDTYREAYRRHFKSAQLDKLESKYNAQNIIYDAVHWLGPWNMERYKVNLLATKESSIPRGIKIKMFPAPAGTALITTQAAVWRAILIYPGTEGLSVKYAKELRLLNEMNNTIRQSRLDFHVFSVLYGSPGRLEENAVKDAMNAAASLAAIAQGFLETIAVDSDLGKAKSLKKHAEQNIALFTIAKAAFAGAQARLKKDAKVKSISQVVIEIVERPTAVRPQVAPVVEEIE